MTEARGGRVDLLQQGRREKARGEVPEAPSRARPEGESWRADALGRSRHSRLDAPPPSPSPLPPEEAEAFTARLCRTALRDFAPALLFLPREDRRRLQALAAYAFTLFDFARQRGVEGERLAQINRWEFTLEVAFEEEGSAAGASARAQPVFLAMAREHRRRAWPEAALDELGAAARERVSLPAPATAAEARARDQRLSAALLTGFLGEPPPGEVAELLGACLRLRRLQDLGEELRQKRPSLAADELPPAPAPGIAPAAGAVIAAAQAAAARLAQRLAAGRPALAALPPPRRRAARYGLLAGQALLKKILGAGSELLTAAPSLGLGTRLGLLLAARWPALAPRGWASPTGYRSSRPAG